jgi:molecular chaperone DnaK
MRETIDYGIDLGTTNSTIAKINNIDVEVFKNNEGFEFTPSAVWMDTKGRLHVGRRAKERLEDDPENAYSEFKLQMGTSNKYLFSRSGIWLTPEQLSTEVLKSLKTDVKIFNGEEITSAVITVPAAFDLPQNKATHAAATMAGFTTCPLLQEPVAAAMAYGFQTKKDNVYWLVYDFGGGTFDAAVIQVKDGLIEVVNHGGDNHLGGKLLDWEIVNELFVPAITKAHKLNNFRRDNMVYRGAFAKLKAQAEQAKIRLSREDLVEINIEYLCKNEQGEPVEFTYELRKSEFEKLARPFVIRSINICKKVLVEKRLGVGDIEKVIMVGGTSLIPFLRDTLVDSNEGLGIELDSSIYPITVVAQGAAIYAGTQRMPKTERVINSDEYFLDLEYSPAGSDLEPPVGGKVTAETEKDYSGYTIEFVNKNVTPVWRSGKIVLNAEGKFFTQLFAEKGKKNIFQIELLDSTGTQQKTIPESISYTPGIVNESIPLTHSIGVGLANNEARVFFEKGTPLTATPVSRRKVFINTTEVRVGHPEEIMKIPFVEGENIKRADRNRPIGYVKIDGSQIKRTIPVGAEVEIIIEIDQSRLVRAKAYIPILDEEIEKVLDLSKTKITKEKLISDFNNEKKRLDEVKKKVTGSEDGDLSRAINQIENERMIHEIENAIISCEQDPDSVDKADNRILDLRIAIDKAEEALEWPELLKKAGDIIEDTRKEVNGKYGDSKDKEKFAFNENEIRQAIKLKDPDLLQNKINIMYSLYFTVVEKDPGHWVGMFNYMKEHKNEMTNVSEADQLISKGDRAINNNDLESLKSAVNMLFRLLPPSKQQAVKGIDSSLI